jgi:hypothetical protein
MRDNHEGQGARMMQPDMIGAARLVMRAIALTGLEPQLAAAWLRRVAKDVEKG